MLTRWSFILLAALAATASASDIAGTWKAQFTCPVGERPKTVSEFTFDFKVEGDQLSGTVRAGSWPGQGPILGGRIEGDRVFFTMIGKLPWSSNNSGDESGGHPKLDFAGRIKGKEMTLMLTWGNVMTHGRDPGVTIFELMGGKVDPK